MRPPRKSAWACPGLRAPLVLAHGLFGFARIGLGPVTFASYFRGIPDFLRDGGNRVLVTTVHPTAGVARRAEMLGAQIRAAFPDEPVHIIAHSMGGLDARALLADAGWRGRVLSLTTIGTPHRGSALADFAQMRVGRIYRLLEALKIDHRGFLDVTREAADAFGRGTPEPAPVPCFSVAGAPAAAEVSWPLRRLHAILRDEEGPNDGLV
ncbi:MAG TPA: alpha/beta fold hydrolase, partial [Isosphaeraceae bacterium]